MHTCTHTHTYAHACTHTHTYAHACTHTHTHACTHTCTHTHTRMHPHTQMLISFVYFASILSLTMLPRKRSRFDPLKTNTKRSKDFSCSYAIDTIVSMVTYTEQ